MRLVTALGLLACAQAACVSPPEVFSDPEGTPDARADGAAPDADGGSCGSLPAEGRCDGDRLITCDLASGWAWRDCAAKGSVCLAGDGLPPRCGDVPTACADLRIGEVCAGDRLYVCHGGWIRHVPCDSLGGRCVSLGPRPGCAPRQVGTGLVTGQITRDHREASPAGLGPLTTAPAAGLTVVVLGAEDRLPLALGVTDDEGRLSIPFDIPDEASGVVLRTLSLAADGRHLLWVTDGEDAAYAVESDPFPLMGETVHAAFHLTEEAGAGAFHIFEVLRALQGAAADLVEPRLPALQVAWERGTLISCGTCFSRYPETIFVSGDTADPDEYDPSVLGHELGHYILWTVSRDDSPGGEHDGLPVDPRLAWSEGAATWVGLQLLGSSLYVDTTITGAEVRDPEDLGAAADPAGGMDQLLSENVVLEILWDITDPATEPSDPVAGARASVLDVLTAYLPSPGLVDRGHPGVDLVELLDGWLCRGQGDQAELGALTTGLGFPYDFGGPAAPCPKPRAPFELGLVVEDRACELRVTLRVTSRTSLPSATAHLRVPLPGGLHQDARYELEPIRPGEPVMVTWALTPGLDPPWVAAGLGAADGSWGERHASVVSRRHDVSPTRIVRMDLGGLLRLRLAGP